MVSTRFEAMAAHLSVDAATFNRMLANELDTELFMTGPHTDVVRPRRDPNNPARRFFVVTTYAVIDRLCQARLVDSGGYLPVVCTMADHDTRSLDTSDDLA